MVGVCYYINVDFVCFGLEAKNTLELFLLFIFLCLLTF